MRTLFEQDILEILYGATLLGGGGGGSLKLGLKMLNKLKEDGYRIEIDLLDVDEIGDDEYAAAVCALGSPVSMLDPDKPMFGPDGVYAFRAYQKAFYAQTGKQVSYLLSGEMGGHNTFTPMEVAIVSDWDPQKRIKLVDEDNNRRACPELNTTLTTYWDLPPTPMGLGSWRGDEIAVYPVSDKSGEEIARQMCQLFDNRIGFSTWGVNKAQMKDALAVGCVTKAQQIGRAYFAARAGGSDLMDELRKATEIREFCRGRIERIETRVTGGFDCGTTVIADQTGRKYFIDFKNENLLLRDQDGTVHLTAPEIIGIHDLEAVEPLTNADTREGMELLVTMSPAHENWWNETRKPYECWMEEIRAIGFEGKPVRY